MFALGQRLDGAHQRLAQALVAQRLHRVAAGVLGLVAFQKTLFALAVLRHVFQVHQLCAAHLAQQGLVVGQRQPQFGRNLGLQRAAAELVFEPAHRLFDVFLAFARAARHPVVLAQFVDHGAANALGGEGFELHALGHLVTRQRFRQTDQADLYQVVHLNAGRQFGHHVVRQFAHQRLVLANQRIAVELALGGVHQ